MNEHTRTRVQAAGPAPQTPPTTDPTTAAAVSVPEGDAFAHLLAVAVGRVDMTVTVTTRPQAQGDIYLQPWPAAQAAAARVAALRAVTDLPRAGVDLLGDGRHVLVPDGPKVAWGGQRSASGLTLGTLVVGDDCAAILSHPVHGDLRIGRGVYVVRRQRGVAPIPEPAALPQPESDDSGSYWAMVMD